MEFERYKLSHFLKQYRIEHIVQDDKFYKQVTISKHTGVSYRGEKLGKEIGRKRQFIIDLKKYPNTLLFVRQGVQDGSVGFAKKDVDECIVTENMPMFSVENVDVEFFDHFIESPKFKDLLKEIETTGSAQKSIHERQILNLVISIPKKIEDQRKLVEKLDSLNGNIDEVSTELTHQLSLISQLRQAFLREAMQGTLVSNETKDGATGAELLAEIQAEKEQLVQAKKIKKQKPLPPISEEGIPFEIPENWVWCKLSDVGHLKRGKSKHRPRNDKRLFVNGQIPFIQTGDVSRSKLTGDIIGTINGYYNDFGLAQSELQKKGTLCITIAANIAESGFLGFDACLPDSIVCFESASAFTDRLVNYFIKVSKSEIEKYAPATAQKNINLSILNDLLFPLPPLEIQERIVAKLDELMHFCDALENSVKESQNANNLLLQQVLREALEGGKNKKEEEILPMVAEDAPIYSINKKYNMSDMAILAGHIINTHSTSNDKDFGRVKLQKMLHLVQFHCNLDAPLQYQKKVAGPYCRDLESQLEQKLKQHHFFDIKKEKINDYEQVVYSKLTSSKDLNRLFANEFEHKADEINSILQKFRSKNTNFCEAVSTMYAVWNNRILKKEPVTDELLKTDFLNWDESKKKFIGKLDDTLDWMRRNGVVPVGRGKVI